VTTTTPSKSFGERLRTLAVLGLLLPVQAYRKLISPLIAPRCRYYPTCSTYAVEALRSYGPLRGSILAAWRVMRCNPFSDGGFDDVADQKLFRHRHSDACADGHNHRGATT
jgi:putative membrane protein insertion efficiency factor